MSKYFLFIIIFLCCFLSCKKSIQEAPVDIKKSDKNIVVNHKTFSKISEPSLKKIEAWKEYQIFDDFIKRFQNISPDEAFDNVTELRELTLALEDSLNIATFKTPSFKSRLHVLENEILRLNDMANIPAITSKEVNEQIDKIFLVYSSLNDKINTVFNQQKFEEEINSSDFFNFGKDSLDSKEKKTANQKKKLFNPKNSLNPEKK